MAREIGEVAVIAVGDDDAVVVADHDHSRHVGCSSVASLWSLIWTCLSLFLDHLPVTPLQSGKNH